MRARLAALVLGPTLALFGAGEASAAAVCSNAPGANDRIECLVAMDVTQDIDIDAANLAITTTGSFHRGVHAFHRGMGGIDIDLNDGSVTTREDSAEGVRAQHSGSGAVSISTRNLSVKTGGAGKGQSSPGVFGFHTGASGGIDVDLTGGSVTTRGSFAIGVSGHFRGAGDMSITLRNAAVETAGLQSSGVFGTFSSRTTSVGDLSVKVEGGSVTTAGGRSYGVWGSHFGSGRVGVGVRNAAVRTTGALAYGVWGYHLGTGEIDLDLTGGSVATTGANAHGVLGYHTGGAGGIDADLTGVSVSTEGLSVRGVFALGLGLGSVLTTTDAETKVEAPFAVGVEARLTNAANASGRVLVANGGAVEARDAGVLAWARRASGSTFGEGTRTADDASRTETMVHVTSSGDVTVGPGVTDAFIRSRIAGSDETISTGEGAVLDAITAGDSDALDAALAALPASYGADYVAEARNLLRKRGYAPTAASALAHLAAAEILRIPRAGIRALALSHFAVADHVRRGDRDPAILAIQAASRTTEQRAALAEQEKLSDVERRVLETALTGGDLEAALAALPAAYADDWKDALREMAAGYNEGDVRVDVTGGTIASEGDGVHARYALAHDRNGAIYVNVSEGAEVAGGAAGIYVSGAGPGRLGKDDPVGEALGLEADEENLRRQFVAVHGRVRGGTDAGVHLGGGGTLLVGRAGEVLAGSSGRAILVNDPGRAIIVIHGLVRGGAGGEAAVHLTGGGSVTIGLAGRVEANGAERAIRGDDAAVTVDIHAPGLDDEGISQAANRVKGAIGGEGLPPSSVRYVAVQDGTPTGETKPAEFDEDGALLAPDLPETPMEPEEPPTPPTFDCAVAGGDRRCELYEALPSLLLAMSRMPAFAKRASAPHGANGVWARVEAARGEWTAEGADSPAMGENLAYDYDLAGGRAGFNVESAYGQFGFSIHILRGEADMKDVGEIALNGAGIGASAAWTFEDFHLDVSGQATWLDAEIDSGVRGKLEKEANGVGFALGAEIGGRMPLEDGLLLAPRAGLTWTAANLGDFTDSVGVAAPTKVSVEDARSVKALMGVTLDAPMKNGGRLFGTLDFARELADETAVKVGDAKLNTDARSTTARLGAGGAFALSGGASLRASAWWQTSGSDSIEYGGGLTFSVRF